MSDPHSADVTGDGLPGWEDYLRMLAPVGQKVLSTTPRAHDPLIMQEAWRSVFASLGQSNICHMQADPDHPVLVPLCSSQINILTPNPDFMYSWTPISSDGIYRITGFRNTALFVEISLHDGFYAWQHNRGTIATIDLDSLTLGPGTEVDFILSRTRPEGWTGDWIELAESVDNLLVRSASCNWANQRDALLAIERLDISVLRPRQSAAGIARKLSDVPAWIERSHAAHHGRLHDLESKGQVNAVQVFDYTSMGGAQGQVYVEGMFDLAPGEALILETDIPSPVRYWSFMLADAQLGTIDWINRQSSINGCQAVMDSDGKFRAVISVDDPSVANWLDTGGYSYGMVWGRWNDVCSAPIPTLRKVRLDELKQHLPADTCWVTAEEREKSVRSRRRAALLRRHP